MATMGGQRRTGGIGSEIDGVIVTLRDKSREGYEEKRAREGR
jgi:hypothetical protein